MISLTSATPDMVADSLTNLVALACFVLFAMILASVVLQRKTKVIRKKIMV